MTKPDLHFERRAFLLAACALTLPALPLEITKAEANPAPDWHSHSLRLLIVEQAGCIYCAQWNQEIAPGYSGTAIGRAAPLMRVDLNGPWPNALVLDSRPVMTPTFILLESGFERARIEGYAGRDNFYPVLAGIMRKAGFTAERTR